MRTIAVVLYLVVDVAYVVLSAPVYNRAVRAIQGRDMVRAKPGFLAAAAFAYAVLALGWWLLVAPAIEAGAGASASVLRAAGLGLAYALAVYGTFNGTLYVMFEKWDAAMAVRDVAWGATALTVLSAAYAWAWGRRGVRARA